MNVRNNLNRGVRCCFNGVLSLRPRALYQRIVVVMRKNGWKMGIFIIWWFFMGHFIIPYLIARSDWWMFSWVTYGPFDEMLLFPIAAYFLMRKA